MSNTAMSEALKEAGLVQPTGNVSVSEADVPITNPRGHELGDDSHEPIPPLPQIPNPEVDYDAQDTEKFVVCIPDVKCLRCTHFMQAGLGLGENGGTLDVKMTAFKRCHYLTSVMKSGERVGGNPHCPAAHSQIVRGLNEPAMVDAYFNALNGNNFAEMNRLHAIMTETEDHNMVLRVLDAAKMRLKSA